MTQYKVTITPHPQEFLVMADSVGEAEFVAADRYYQAGGAQYKKITSVTL